VNLLSSVFGLLLGSLHIFSEIPLWVFCGELTVCMCVWRREEGGFDMGSFNFEYIFCA